MSKADEHFLFLMMKKIFIYTFLASLIALSCNAEKPLAENIVLPREWKFKTGDNPDYSKTDFNDHTWKTIDVENFWETQGYVNYDGIAWYRTKVVIPSSFKERNEVLRYLILQMGRIDDEDDTYFNGVHIGRQTSWDLFRSYLIPINLIKWDQENVLAIRVNDILGNGGMYGGPNRITDIRLANALALKSVDKPLEFSANGENEFTRKLFFDFKVPIERIDGTLSVKVYNPANNEIVFRYEDNISVGSKADSSYSIKVQIGKPDTYQLEYCFYSESVADTLRYSTLFSYMSTPHTDEHFEYPVVKLAVPDKTAPLGLENIQFEGYLDERLNANLKQRLLNIDETGILKCYYNRPGVQTWVGEFAGKYLHAASRIWRSTKNVELKTQMDRIADILIGCQNPDGYLGTYLPENYWTEWDVWAHKYNLLGLLSYYSATGYKPALSASIKMGDLLCRTFGENDGQLNIINSSSHIGMASTSVLEPMTYLYRYTGDKKYLDFCNYIIKVYEYDKGPKIISTLTSVGKVDKVANGKAYEMTSNLTGIVKLYQLTGDEKLLKAAENAWNDITANKLYITGTASKGELFQEDFVLPAENDDNMGEGCVTTTWLQFSQALYYLTGEAKHIDEIEKTIYNHLLAAENPLTGCVAYYTALQGKKPFRCNIDSHCCMASVPRAIAAIPELTFVKNSANGLNINLYTAGKFADKIVDKNGKEVSLQCNISSKFPEDGNVTITVAPENHSDFRISLRVPAWSKNFKAVVDGKLLKGTPGEYLNIDNTWTDKSEIQISFDLNTQVLEGGKSYPGYIAIKTGPQVLAIDQALNPQIQDVEKVVLNSSELIPLSGTLLPKEWIGSQIYGIKALYEGKPVDLKLVPFADAGQTGGEIRVWIKNK